jgi:hypothetical protein
MAPPQALLREDLVDAAALDRDPLLLVEMDLQPVQGPAGEGQAQVLRGSQRRGDDLGPLLCGVDRRPAGAGALLEPGDPVLVEAADPGIDGGSGAAGRLGDGGGGSAVGGGLDDSGPFGQADRGGARAEQVRDGLLLLGRHRAESDSGGHGHLLGDTSIHLQITCRMHH